MIHKLQALYRTQETGFAFLGIRLLGTPLWSLLSFLIFVLYKYTGASPLQIAIVLALKPTSSLLSPYWSQAIYKRPDQILRNLIGANCLRHILFLCIPWVQTSWFIIFSFGLYMVWTRAMFPAWIELFAHKIPKTEQEKWISAATVVDYVGAAIFTVGCGFVLDQFPTSWPWIFFSTACLGLASTLLLVPLRLSIICYSQPDSLAGQWTVESLKEKIFGIWKQIWQLLRARKDFALFQIGFMFGGAGLMIMHPALPQFFLDELHLSFVEMGCATALCKGIGVVCTSPLWARFFRRVHLFHFNALVTSFACLFPFLLLASNWHLWLLYIAYLIYGMMQAGSEMSWHMSSLVFAEKQDSSLFSMTNVLTVGLRGSVIPLLGSYLLSQMPSLGIILLGAFFCLMGSAVFALNARHAPAFFRRT